MIRSIGSYGQNTIGLFIAYLVAATLLCNSCGRSLPHQQQIYAFGTVVTLQTFGTSEKQFADALSELERQFRIIDVDWYPWARQGSERHGDLVSINKSIAAGQPIAVEPQLAALIRRASEIELLSGGLFSPATGRLTQLWGLDDVANPPTSLPAAEEIRTVLAVGINSRSLRWSGNTLSSANRDILLDLGGIAKGAILGISIKILLDHGIRNAIVDIGGDLTVLGSVNGSAARIGIRSPSAAGTAGWLFAADGETVVTSGDYERYFELDGQRYPHILDPRNGYPVTHTASVTVVHGDPVLADAAATALVVGGAVEFADICQKLGVSQALLIDSSGDLRLTPAMRKRVKWATTRTSY